MRLHDRAHYFILAIVAIWFATSTVAAGERETGTDRPGLDYRDFAMPAPLPGQCEAACNEETKCRAWTFAWPGKKSPRAHCFLKSGLPPKKSDNCCISGIKTKQTTTTPTKEPDAPPQPPAEPAPAPEPDLGDVCRKYADTAAEQNKKNDELFCGLTGSRWGVSRDVYYKWCMEKSSAQSRKDNTEARNRELLECGAFIPTPVPEAKEPRDMVRENACREYANRSVEQAEQAREHDCALTGPRWATGFQRHFSWCMSVSDAYPAKEIEQRRAALQSCRPQQSFDEGCEQYARAAFRLARQNYERRCGFVGPRWVRSIDAHKAWCLGADVNKRKLEQTARHKALAACSGGPREIGACARYAQTAVRHAIQGRDRNCGFSGTRWRPEYEEHFAWCMSATPPQRFKERTYRQRTLLKCGRNNRLLPDNERQFLYRYRWT
ncbi:MAG: hypothetical protein HKN11_00915, partial [Rhizobiales bacterium]|nr:hypothetical protein [Hyphomicrobiales bacterium]